MKTADTRIIPIKQPNQIDQVTKSPCGGLIVRQKSGKTFTVPASDADAQAFVIWSILNKGF